MNSIFSPASLDLAGCPALASVGPLVTPNLYTPPGVALTVCDTTPWLTTYSVTLNSVTLGTLAGEINEAYVYIKGQRPHFVRGEEVGDLVLTWVSEEQGNVELTGYIEGAPPCPMANLTNKSSYAGATSITLSAPTSVTLKYQQNNDWSDEIKRELTKNAGIKFGMGTAVSPFGFGLTIDKDTIITFEMTAGDTSTLSALQ